MNFIANVVFAYDTLDVLLDLESLSNFLKYAFVGANKSLHVINAFDLDQDQEKIWLTHLGRTKIS